MEKRPTVALYLNELLITIKVSIQRSGRSTFSHLGLPPMGPWHHVGATMEYTLDKNRMDHFSDPLGTEPQHATADATY